jgi:DNA-binding MarR family transcriptional regulator
VMESLADADKSVPAIASEKEVTRQHIQTIVNELLGAGLVQRIENPAHKRSSLIALTPQGKKVLAAILEREADLIPAIAQQLQHLELRTTADTLEQLLDYFGSDRFNELTQQIHRVSRKRRKKS